MACIAMPEALCFRPRHVPVREDSRAMAKSLGTGVSGPARAEPDRCTVVLDAALHLHGPIAGAAGLPFIPVSLGDAATS